MADAVVSMVLNRLAPLIEKRVREEVCLLLNASKEAQNLSEKLKKIHHVLADAERKGVADPRVKSWLKKLQDIAYDIDNVLDEWELENIRQKVLEEEEEEEEEEDANISHDEASSDSDGIDSWEKKVCSFLQSVCLCFKQTIHRRSIAKNIKAINGRLDSIAQENENEFNFIPNLGRDTDKDEFKRIVTTSFVDVSEILGRDHDKETLMCKLLSETSSLQNGVQTISIVGVGGMGKTSLAQLVFNDVTVKSQFELKIWVCVSDPFDEIKIAKAILEVTDKNSLSLTQPQALLQSIEKLISGQKFLLVLDDVWEDDDSKWRPLRACLKNGAPGSRILVTTRKTKVAKIMGSTYIHSLERLSDSYCWSVLSQIAFQEREEAECEMLKETGMQIAKKCKGLPLAARTIGGLLRFKASLQEWQDVSREMWEPEEARKDLFPLLTLSYNELHPEVKRCVSYCAIFPKDTRINVDELIRIWMAHGFLSLSGNTVREMEQIGRNYFDDLAMHSFFQDFEKYESCNNRITHCKMHDIIHDFAQFLTENDCLIVERVDRGTQVVSCQNTHHLTIVEPKDGTNLGPLRIWEAEQLRSCFCNRNGIPQNLFSCLKQVRLLSLRACNLGEIPEEIGNLIHIRYLDLSYNPIKDLPESIYDLYYLPTLYIMGCLRLSGLLDHGIHKLINLRHLLNDETGSFKFPQGFEKLTNLRTLNQLIVSSTSGNNLGCLKGLNRLGGTLLIQLWDEIIDEVEAAKKADLESKKCIQTLRLEVLGDTRMQVVEALRPHPKLQILVYTAPQLPNWIISLTNLKELWFTKIHAENAYSSPPLGKLPLLQRLGLSYWTMKGGSHDLLWINTTTAAASSSISIFPKLKVLEILSCKFWEEWEDISEEQQNNTYISIFPCLHILRLRGCDQLKALPHRLLHKASSLQLLDIFACSRDLYSRYNPESGQDWTLLSHIPRVDFTC